ncbi:MULTISPECIES: Z1 domain-containing protein [unclassified Spiroplasma]|uniref:Z1 domain-containing protein n=1 Tax=unclassified Spiroplasma TaxID=2637901 RepID=UPI0030D34C69
MVERGITFPNLLVTFITRRAKNTTNADTALQSARWFGYREKFLQYIRIFCKNSIDEDFKKILIAEEALWFELKEWEKSDDCLKEWKIRAIKLDKDIRPTRKGAAKIEQTSLVAWCAQNAIIKNNESEEKLYFELLNKAIPQKYGLNIIHKEITFNSIKEFELDFENISTKILDKCKIKYEDWEELKDKNSYPLKVIFMRPNDINNFKRKQYENGYVSIFAGKSGNYKGDRYLTKYPNNEKHILLEIHMFDIMKNNTILEKNAIFYALYIPEEE